MNIKLIYFLSIIGLIVLGMTAVDNKATGSMIGNKGNITAEEIEQIENPVPSTIAMTINAEGEILHYQKRSSWEEVDFSEILASTADFETDARDAFERNLERYNVQALDIAFEFHEKKNSVIVECNIRGAMYGTNSYDFHWLLGDLPFDLYQFKQHDKELAYDGAVNEVPTEIRLIFPYGVAHCHEHVWPR